ncbi:hypothetical protein F01_480173 [Burkholderia cenocepacia]|nr:hypothetical protein F01_480173 [Burkholderia cenocepacia]
MSLPKGESVGVSMSGALNVSVCDRKKHPVWLKLPFADLETIHAYFLEKPRTKSPGRGRPGRKIGPRAVSARPVTGYIAGGRRVPAGILRGRGGDVPEARSGNAMMACATR